MLFLKKDSIINIAYIELINGDEKHLLKGQIFYFDSSYWEPNAPNPTQKAVSWRKNSIAYVLSHLKLYHPTPGEIYMMWLLALAA